MRISTFLGSAVLCTMPIVAANAAPAAIPGVKNIIVLINDGGGYTVYDALRLYKGKPLVTDGAGFHRISISTYPLRIDSTTPGSLAQDPAIVYSSAKFWDTTPVAGNSVITGYSAYPAGFRGYEYSRLAHPDSGNTATSLATGVKSYNNAINVNGAGDVQITITDLIDQARAVGKGTGVVSTVQFADATPAALGGAHNIARSNGNAIAAEMFSSGKLDVIGGTGNPDYDDNGVLRAIPNYQWVSAPLWADLKNRTNTTGLNTQKWKLLQNRSDIDALAAGTARPPKKLAMIARSFASTQYNRASLTPPTSQQPFVTDAPKTDVPSQRSLTLAALNTLGKNPRGFYLMTEAGAVDRAEHGNSTGRMIEELNDSNDTVQAIIDWVNRADTAATWDDTLLIVTADHDHLLYGPDAATVPFQPLVDKGAGNVPGNRWFGPNHGTGLVPFYAYGKGAVEITALATDNDSFTGSDGTTRGYGPYTDQTVIGQVLKLTVAQ